MRSPSARESAGLLLALVAVAAAAGVIFNLAQDHEAQRAHAAATTGGDPARGEAMFIDYGCGSCHQLAHVRKATGKVGPPLDGIAARAMIAGKLPNTPQNLQHWIRDPQQLTPGTDMPDLRVGERDARDISAFLYTRAS